VLVGGDGPVNPDLVDVQAPKVQVEGAQILRGDGLDRRRAQQQPGVEVIEQVEIVVPDVVAAVAQAGVVAIAEALAPGTLGQGRAGKQQERRQDDQERASHIAILPVQ